MNDMSSAATLTTRGYNPKSVGYVILAVALLLTLAKFVLPQDLIRPPDWLVLSFADWINAAFTFLRDDLGLMQVTRLLPPGLNGCSISLRICYTAKIAGQELDRFHGWSWHLPRL